MLQKRLAGVFGVTVSLLNRGPLPLVVGFFHGAHAARQIGGRFGVLCGRAIYEVQQVAALGAEFQRVRRTHVRRLANVAWAATPRIL